MFKIVFDDIMNDEEVLNPNCLEDSQRRGWFLSTFKTFDCAVQSPYDVFDFNFRKSKFPNLVDFRVSLCGSMPADARWHCSCFPDAMKFLPSAFIRESHVMSFKVNFHS